MLYLALGALVYVLVARERTREEATATREQATPPPPPPTPKQTAPATARERKRERIPRQREAKRWGEERSGWGGGERRGVVVGERRGVVGVEECVWEKDLGGARLGVYAVAEVVAVLAQHEEAVVREQ
jgi:hypothetical protein